MSVPSISCSKCSAPMPANYAWCPNCGHTNAFVAQETAFVPPGPRPGAEGTDTAATSGEVPTGGAPTVNIGETGDAARYTPPPDASAAAGAAAAGAGAAWQPGQYSNAPMQPVQPQQPQPPPQGQYMQQQPYAPPPTPPYGQYGQPQQPYPYATTPPKDPTVALLLELIGLVGFLGIGHIYSGRTNRGVALLVGWLVCYLIGFFVAVPLVMVGSVFTCGIGCLLFIPLILIWLGVPVGSGLWIKNDLEKENAMRRL